MSKDVTGTYIFRDEHVFEYVSDYCVKWGFDVTIIDGMGSDPMVDRVLAVEYRTAEELITLKKIEGL